MRWSSLYLFAVLTFLLLISAASASGATLCTVTTLDQLVPVVSVDPAPTTGGTTCDIGQFQYTFQGYLTKNGTTAQPNLPGPLIGDFTFVPFVAPGGLSSGFTLDLSTPMTLTAPPGGAAFGQEFFQLFFQVKEADPTSGEVIPTPLITAANLSVSGNAGATALAEINGLEFATGCVLTGAHVTNCYRSESVGPGGASNIFNFGPDFQSGFGDVGVFLNPSNGGTASWDPSLTFSLPQAPPTTTPEPASLLLFGTGLVGIGPVLRRRLRK